MVSIVASTGAFVSEPVQGKQVFDSLRLPLKVSFLLGPVVRKSLHAVRDSSKRLGCASITLPFDLSFCSKRLSYLSNYTGCLLSVPISPGKRLNAAIIALEEIRQTSVTSLSLELTAVTGSWTKRASEDTGAIFM